MKKFKKIIAMCLTAAMALSVMSIGAFASDMATFSARGAADVTETREIREGVLPNGLKYTVVPMTQEQIDQLNSGVATCSYSWSGNVTVPISNADGTNGAQLGYDFIISPDTVAVITVGSLPQTTMPTINIGASATNGMWNDWIPNIEGNSLVYLEPGEGYAGYSYRVKVSTFEANSRSARFAIETE